MRAPVGLQAPGRALWREVMAHFVPNPGEKMILEKACRTADRLARLEKIEAELDDLEVAGSTGQVRMHPVTEEIRKNYLLLGRLIEQLAIPDEADEYGVKAATKKAQRAANARWSRREAS